MRAPSASWTSWKCTVLLCVAEYSFTGTLTSPKVTVPFHSERAMPCPLPVRARAHAGGAGSLPADRRRRGTAAGARSSRAHERRRELPPPHRAAAVGAAYRSASTVGGTKTEAIG